MKRLSAIALSFAVAVVAALSITGAAQASGEVASSALTMTPQSPPLYKDAKTPVNWRLEVKIEAPFPANPKVLPMKQVTVNFPKDMSFNPDPKTPICGDDQVGPAPVNLSVPPDTVIARCPDSVLGNGTAKLYLAQNNGPNGPNLPDPVLVVFNGGKNAQGQPKLKIYGYSAQTKAGIYMEGALINGELDIKIPVLTFDSAVGEFNLNIPGSNAAEANRRGVDKGYVQASCSTGEWLTNASFVLGTRNTAGNPTSPDVNISAPEAKTACEGVAGGKAAFGKPKVKGPAKAKKGKKTTYKVTVKNTGKSSITGVKVVASGKGAKGKASAGTLAGGKSKTVKVKVKFSKKGKIKTKFKVSGKGASAKTVTKMVKVK